ncbi:hypothetical protein D3C83_96730 [compost metagenome]
MPSTSLDTSSTAPKLNEACAADNSMRTSSSLSASSLDSSRTVFLGTMTSWRGKLDGNGIAA